MEITTIMLLACVYACLRFMEWSDREELKKRLDQYEGETVVY